MTESDNSTEALDVKEEDSRKAGKLWLMMCLIFIGLGVIIVRLFIIQVLDSDEYRQLAKKQHESEVYLRAERGLIYDRFGRLIVTNISSISVAIDPTYFDIRDVAEKRRREALKKKICNVLSEIVGVESGFYLKKINTAKSAFVWLERGLHPEKAKKLKEINFKGLILIEEPKRFNLYGETGTQITGRTNIDNQGISGVEKEYDSLLQGRGGYMIMYRDALGYLHPSAGLPVIPARNGSSLKLTIDIELQRIIEYELREGIRKFRAETGTVIAMLPESGEIIAMASLSKVDSKMISPIHNKGITDLYEPGSTFKLITAAMALETAVIGKDEIFNGYNGMLKIGDIVIVDDHPLNKATLTEAFQYSSNIIFSNIANRFPGNKFYKFIRSFGFGSKYKLGLPGEVSGKLASPDDLNATTKRFVGFGYGISATSLQIMNAYSAIANDGILMQPYIVSAAFDYNGEVIFNNVRKKIRRVVNKRTSEILTKMLITVVERGTGTRAKIQGIKIAGKTGTTKQIIEGVYSDSNYNASFVGFFPAEKPRIVIYVSLEKPMPLFYGGLSAAPIFRNIALRLLSVHPQMMKRDIYSIDEN